MFGGAFDPPHHAHVALARAAVQELRLDHLLVVPTGQAWHKARQLTPAEHRFAMARLAFGGVPRATVDNRELRRAGPTYTVDTLRELAAEFPGATLYLLMGDDQAAGFTSWHDWAAIARLAVLCIAARGPSSGGLQALRRVPGVRVEPIVSMAPLPDSASDIRARLTSGQDFAELVPPDVASYIEHHNLYAPA